MSARKFIIPLLSFAITCLVLLQTPRNNGSALNLPISLSKVSFPINKMFERPTRGSNPHCTKANLKQTFKVCETLPFSEIQCGEDIVKNITYHGKDYLVPDIAFFIWFGKDLKFNFFNYLALRSVAANHRPKRIDFYFSEGLPVGKHWDRALREIPCLNLKKMEEPKMVGGVTISHPIQRTDMARLKILLEEGGIYIDGDMITLKSLDPMRIYPVAVGRATENNACICVTFSKKNSIFMKEYYKFITTSVPVDKTMDLGKLFTRVFGKFLKNSLVKVHIEESSFNRPNPYVPQDGPLSTTMKRMDISSNYFLHFHTSGLWNNKELDANWVNWEEDDLRKLDGVYGEAARLALFGSPDLVYLPGEETHEMQPQIKMVQFSPIKQERAVLDETPYDFKRS